MRDARGLAFLATCFVLLRSSSTRALLFAILAFADSVGGSDTRVMERDNDGTGGGRETGGLETGWKASDAISDILLRNSQGTFSALRAHAHDVVGLSGGATIAAIVVLGVAMIAVVLHRARGAMLKAESEAEAAAVLVLQQTAAAIAIQRRYRGFAARTAYSRSRRSIIVAQAVVRGFIARARFAEMVAAKAAQDAADAVFARLFAIQNAAVLRLQCVWRGYVARKQYAAAVDADRRAKAGKAASMALDVIESNSQALKIVYALSEERLQQIRLRVELCEAVAAAAAVKAEDERIAAEAAAAEAEKEQIAAEKTAAEALAAAKAEDARIAAEEVAAAEKEKRRIAQAKSEFKKVAAAAAAKAEDERYAAEAKAALDRSWSAPGPIYFHAGIGMRVRNLPEGGFRIIKGGAGEGDPRTPDKAAGVECKEGARELEATITHTRRALFDPTAIETFVANQNAEIKSITTKLVRWM